MKTDHVVSLLGKVLEKANGLIAAALEERGHPGLVPSHGAILVRLYEQGSLPMGVLAESIGRKKNTVTTLIKKLEEEGYVKRTPSLADSRVSLISLTAKGEAFRSDFLAVSDKLLSAVWGDMEVAEREVLVAGLERLARNLS
ncbi:MarR family transcriptional regulator [Desulfovibrio mangrovi]|uniref:MarR family winged helix-turn-helix transcriptional regulator n=1 Tax=Desulfovibrio mangrovi TaxID=2976983 RepID=UPI002246FCA8|nr:MarR family transcriptional regulator [Desulfovibrio mangrovi]UZP66699.1 MarR family transcriptional regulator [Desulfovibrio mangrovi]